MGNCCIGTPDDAIAHISDLLERSGGFGTLLMLDHDRADPQTTYHSCELFAGKVRAALQGSVARVRGSHEWAKNMRGDLLGRAGEAIVKAVGEHATEQS